MEPDYIINSSTLALLPAKNNTTHIIELDREFYLPIPVHDVVDDSCKYFGSSLLGRQEGSHYLLGCSYKLPIILEETREMILFPTTSSQNTDCCWICLNNLESYMKQEDACLLLFKNDIPLLLSISYGSFENQFFRATKLLLTLQKKKNR